MVRSLLAVEWDPKDAEGTRFAHTRIPVSDGRQLLRGNTIFGLDHTREIVLEVWHDSSRPVPVRSAELRIRELGHQGI
jgi:hypothetical protein